MTKSHYGDWQPVIGLEIHAQLNTKSKLFSVAPNRFGDEPNVNITEVCTGQPGALPVLNKEAVRKAVQFGCAIGGNVQKFSKFDRKSYFYPDSPRNFQITQLQEPIVLGGTITAEVDGVEMTFAVTRVHIEDDAGMLKHFSTFAGVDYNRAGVPLIEIVSEPVLHSPQQASAYAIMVRAILQYLDACDCNMEEGSLRFDANISVRKIGETGLRPRTEIKNMNSFSNMSMAIEAEIHRQIQAYQSHPNKPHIEICPQSTYRFDPETKGIVLMRTKESADDYRYFPEPDLPPILLTQAYIDEIRASLPELPLEREHRYIEELGLSGDNAFQICADKVLADYFDRILAHTKNARAISNWVLVEFPGRLKDLGQALPTSAITPEHVAELINLIDTGKITGRMAKAVADDMVASPGKAPADIVKQNPDYSPVSNTAEIEPLVDKVLLENPQSIVDYQAGRTKAFAFLVGKIMALTKGKADPAVVNKLLQDKINGMGVVGQ